jgi:tetratricopeptide (TPR) repeat protein
MKIFFMADRVYSQNVSGNIGHFHAARCSRRYYTCPAFTIRHTRDSPLFFEVQFTRQSILLRFIFAIVVLLFLSIHVHAAAYQDVEKLFHQGQYDACATECQKEIDNRTWNVRWTTLLIRCQLERGEYDKALQQYEVGLERFGDDTRLRLLGSEVYNYNNRPADARKQIAYITNQVQQMPWRYSGTDELVALGKLLVKQGEDARQVLELCYDRALKQNASNIEALQASIELALDKGDYAVAAQTVDTALAVEPDRAHLHYLKALAWQETDSEQSDAAIHQAIKLNPQHVPSILIIAENQIDAEEFEAAETTIQSALKVNPHHPIAWSLRSIVAHLQGDYDREGECRREAMKPWNVNPEVDFKIGQKLSRHYRFEEAIAAQRRALTLDGTYQPAMFALAQDLLRVGRTDEGWTLLNAVRTNDQYNVVAFNLSKLKDQLDKFATLESDGFVVRMEAREAKVYGAAVLELLRNARLTLAAKYKVTLEEPTYVEIFDRQQDFAIRTFGLPGGAGYLGVCFGRLITANSPVSGGETPTNWQSVLWHEYCHVITLQKTKNRMPRWLSEGISVYEERVQDATWGQPMDRTYREMILGDDFTPLSQLSISSSRTSNHRSRYSSSSNNMDSMHCCECLTILDLVYR